MTLSYNISTEYQDGNCGLPLDSLTQVIVTRQCDKPSDLLIMTEQ